MIIMNLAHFSNVFINSFILSHTHKTQVCKSLGILEKEYFGLRYADKNGEPLWVNLCNPLHEQLVPAPGHRPVMEMRVKYFIRPQKILQPVTR